MKYSCFTYLFVPFEFRAGLIGFTGLFMVPGPTSVPHHDVEELSLILNILAVDSIDDALKGFCNINLITNQVILKPKLKSPKTLSVFFFLISTFNHNSSFK